MQFAIEFLVFCFLQALAINGFYEACQGNCVNDINKGRICNGNIFYKISPSFFERNKSKTWAMPFFGCVKCMASIIGGSIYWPTVLIKYGFYWQEIPLWFFNILILVSLNYWVYKNI